MTSLVLAAVCFVALHLGVAGSRLRDRLVGRLGESRYLGLFSLASFLGLVWLATAYADAPIVVTWGQLPALRPLAIVAVLLAFLLAVPGLTTPSPTAVGGEAALEAEEPAVGIQRVTRHPFLWGVTVWAAVHLVVNGHVKALVLFGALLVLGVTGPRSIDAKRARRFGARWTGYAAVTSSLPFLAIAQGRNRFRAGEIGWGRFGFTLAVFAVVLLLHPLLFGANPLGFLVRAP